jgi:hypothetical protein
VQIPIDAQIYYVLRRDMAVEMRLFNERLSQYLLAVDGRKRLLQKSQEKWKITLDILGSLLVPLVFRAFVNYYAS